MAQPGWHPDPQGSGGLRWWDGQQWTGHVQPAPPPAPYPPATGPVVDMTHRGKHLHADAQVVSYGGTTLPLADIEWVAYWSVEHYIKGTLGVKMGAGSDWFFQVGRYPHRNGPKISVEMLKWRTKTVNEVWQTLVTLARQHLQPRLVTDLAARIRAGQSIDLGAGVSLGPGGLASKRVSLGWPELAGATLDSGYAVILRTGHTPALKIPQQNPNAVLLPDLIPAVRR